MSKEDLLKQLHSTGKLTQGKVTKIFTQLWNDACRPCQKRWAKVASTTKRNGEVPSYDDYVDILCDDCTEKAEQAAKDALEELQ